jgi:hypothetical protein
MIAQTRSPSGADAQAPAQRLARAGSGVKSAQVHAQRDHRQERAAAAGLAAKPPGQVGRRPVSICGWTEACTAREVQITASQGICGAERRSKIPCITALVAVVWVMPQ